MRLLKYLIVLIGFANCYGDPYLWTKSEFKGEDNGYQKAINNINLGYDWNIDSTRLFFQGGLGVESPRGEDLWRGDEFRYLEVGATLRPNKAMQIKAKFEDKFFSHDSSWKFEVKTRYYLFRNQ